MHLRTLTLAMIFALLPARAPAETACVAKSGAITAPVVELYTSEGCDSCPPADKWFSTLNSATGTVVPLAFHVDYWDYLGWRDSFGQAAFSLRQREAVKRQGGHVAYTPQVLLDGRDFRAWFHDAELDKKVAATRAQQARAQIELAVNLHSGVIEVAARVFVPGVVERAQSGVFFAITENNLVSRVSAGENKGVTLKHDHVVRELLGPLPIAEDGKFSATRSIALGDGWKTHHLSAVVFVQDQKTGATLQALSLPVCAS